MPKGQLSRVMIRRLHLTDGAAPKHCQERAPHHDHHDAVGIVRSTQLSFPGAASGFMQETVSIDPAKIPAGCRRCHLTAWGWTEGRRSTEKGLQQERLPLG
jgi:hypothetical protein